ncbi:hypothetical protein BSU04_22910 [Caballeronia sordidicola]|uniref:Uncharacterized protein n=1 Tax=Caballeronia sordidicola TaxID=196367 RepID=A0A226X060_CABSO|nr:hypothetical protein BSU04_22910 [Caballeronia sordidicola]
MDAKPTGIQGEGTPLRIDRLGRRPLGAKIVAPARLHFAHYQL